MRLAVCFSVLVLSCVFPTSRALGSAFNAKVTPLTAQVAHPLAPIAIRGVQPNASTYFRLEGSGEHARHLVGILVSFVEEPTCKKFAGFTRAREADTAVEGVGSVPVEKVTLLASVEELRMCAPFAWEARRLITVPVPDRGNSEGAMVVRLDTDQGPASYLVMVADRKVTVRKLP